MDEPSIQEQIIEIYFVPKISKRTTQMDHWADGGLLPTLWTAFSNPARCNFKGQLPSAKMKTPEQIELHELRLMKNALLIRLAENDEEIMKLRKQLAEGERRGRIAGLREAAAICSRLGLPTDARVALSDEANWLEKEQRKSISSDTPETKTKQER